MVQTPHSTHEAGLRRALMAGIAANFGVGVAKFAAFLATRSAAMLAEAVHSLADTSNQALLLIGLRRSRRPASEQHPFGYAAERYFWTFVVAMNIFAMGSVVAIYEGIEKIRHPHPLEDPKWNFMALGVAAIFEGIALRIAWREFQHWQSTQNTTLWRSLREAKDLSLPTVLFEDSAALLGLVFAATGIGLSVVLHDGLYDGIASILIGLVLLAVAWFLARESHSLLIGEAASPDAVAAIRSIVAQDPAVSHLVRIDTLQRGPGHILVALVLEFNDEMRADDIESAVLRMEKSIREEVPAARDVFIEAGAWRRAPGPPVDHPAPK